MSARPRSMLVLATLALSGCANVAFYADPGLTQPTAIKLPLPKPYLLVTYAQDPQKPATAQIITLPDPDHAIYARREGFIGSTEISASWTNGAMAALGAKTDPKSDAFLTALTGFATAVGIFKIAEEKPPFELFEIVSHPGRIELRPVEIKRVQR